MCSRPRSLVVPIVLLLASGLASAATQRTFVASTGADTNSCALAQPCRSFAAAIAQTTAGGEIIVLDSAGYGPVTIGKPLSIIAPAGIYAGVTVQSGAGITVDTPGPTDVVVLRGLTLTGLGGSTGIHVAHVGSLHVSHVEVAGFSARGINFVAGSFNAAEPALLSVTDSVFRENGETGVHVEPPASTTASAAITRSRFERNTFNGVAFAGTTLGSISDSSAHSNGNVGFLVDPSSDTSITDCRATDSYHGVLVRGASAVARISRCTASGTTNGFTSMQGAKATIVDTVAQGAYGGFVVQDNAIMMLERCTASDGYSGMAVTGQGGAVLRVSASAAVNTTNGFGVVPGAGTIETRQNNSLRGNNSDYNGSVVPFPAL